MFSIPVKMEKLQKRRGMAGFLHILAGIFLLVIGTIIETGESNMIVNVHMSPLTLVVGIVSIVYGFFRRKIDPRAKANSWIRIAQSVAFIIKAITVFNVVETFTIISLFIWAAVTLMLFYTERKMLRPSELSLANEGITVPGEFKDHMIPWTLVNGVVLRADYLTITREDGTFAQLEVTKDLDPSFIQAANTFASEKIAANQNTTLNDQ